MSTIYNPNKYSKKGAYLTKEDADMLYRKATGPLLVSSETVAGDEVVNGDSTVLGNFTANTITSQNAVTLGQNSSLHTLYGSLTISGGRLYTNNGLSIQYCFDASPSQMLLYKLPRIDSAISVTPSNSRDLVTKQYADDNITNLKTATNTWTNSNTFNNALIVAGSGITPSSSVNLQVRFAAKFSETEGSVFYTIPKIDLVNPTITDDKHITTKLYVDNKFATAASKRDKTDTYMISECTYTYADPSIADKWWIVPPKVRSGGGYHTFYINFPKFTVNAKENTFLTQTCTFDLTYYFAQTSLISGTVATLVSGSPWNSTYHKLGGKPNNSTYAPSTMAANRAEPITNIIGTYTVTTGGGVMNVTSAYQSTILYAKPTASAFRPAATSIKTKVNGSDVTFSPMQITYISDDKFRVELGFPVITNNTTIQNSPFNNDWISAYGATIKIKNSAPFYDGSLAETVLAPENNTTLNTPSGCAYITLS